ncbi:MAG: protein phosphatase 2C domain-containing protein, partial [Candidatus Acidiferrales bacterium]
SRTDVGRVRESNEDHFRVIPELSLMIVSDGMGGEASGEVASELAVETIARHCAESVPPVSSSNVALQRPDLSARTNLLLNAVQFANRRIHVASLEDPEKHGMGATVVAAWLEGLRLSLVHVGDSRAYLFRSGALERLTYDHTLVAEQVRIGILTPQQADTSAWQSVLIRALGTNEQVDLDVEERQLLPGDVLLLCSDGLTRMVRDPDIGNVLASAPSAQAAAERLVTLANQGGGEDNVTVVVMRIPPEYPAP